MLLLTFDLSLLLELKAEVMLYILDGYLVTWLHHGGYFKAVSVHHQS